MFVSDQSDSDIRENWNFSTESGSARIRMKHGKNQTLHLSQFSTLEGRRVLTNLLSTGRMVNTSIEMIEGPETIWFLDFESENEDLWSLIVEKPIFDRKWEVNDDLKNAFFGLTQNRFEKHSYKIAAKNVSEILEAAIVALEKDFKIVELAVKRNSSEHYLFITSEVHSHLPLFQNCESTVFLPTVA